MKKLHSTKLPQTQVEATSQAHMHTPGQVSRLQCVYVLLLGVASLRLEGAHRRGTVGHSCQSAGKQ